MRINVVFIYDRFAYLFKPCFMDRMISDPRKTKLFKEFEYIDMFPYAIALIMVLAEIYIVHQFIVVTPFVQY